MAKFCSRGLTEARKVCQFGGVVRHGPHEPVNGCLPHCVKQATENVHQNSPCISMVKYIHLRGISQGRICLAGILPIISLSQQENIAGPGGDSLLIKVCPNMDEEHHSEEKHPSSKSTETPREFFLVKDEPNKQGSNDLG